MKLSRSELEVLRQIALGDRNIASIAKTLHRSKVQIYRCGQSLIKKEILTLKRGYYEPKRAAYISILLELLRSSPALVEPLSGSGIDFLTILSEPKTLKELMEESNLKRTMVFKKIKQAKSISLLLKTDDRYKLNHKIWQRLIDFLQELKKHEEMTDPRVIPSSLIYHKTKEEIIFSNREELDATQTAFSRYNEYRIKLMLTTYYYYLPKKKLTLQDIFWHSLLITEKDPHYMNIIFVALFYAKHKKHLVGIKHDMIDNLHKIFEGERIPNYPSLKEIEDRAEVYDIKLQ